MNANRIKDVVAIKHAGTMPNNERYLIADCTDFDVYKTLPEAVEFQGEEYVKTGWNSDVQNAYYKNGRPIARAVKPPVLRQIR